VPKYRPLWIGCALLALAQVAVALPADRCPRPTPGSAVPQPRELRSREGVLELELSVRNQREPDGSMRYCYLLPDGAEAPTLRLAPGDLLILRLRNELRLPSGAARGLDPCHSGIMSPAATNLHFHGLTIPAVCHQDDVLKTAILPTDAPFEYRFRIPQDEPPGLYWYHPHIHGVSKAQVLGGASGALIVEGIERVNVATAALPERVLVIRDQDLLHPHAPPSRYEPVVPKMFIERDGDSANNGTGFGLPAKDLSLNFVPVPYPDYPPAPLRVRPAQRELWRVLNASAITYLNLAVLAGTAPQSLGIVGIDGVPLGFGDGPGPAVQWSDHIGIPPGGRAEFLVTTPPVGVRGLLVTRSVDTGQGGENDPNRALAALIADDRAPQPRSSLAATAAPRVSAARPWLGGVDPVRVRKLYFSEELSDPNDPNSATRFFLTVEGQTPAAFDPSSDVPNIVARQGEVEDWIIENRSTELHAFHIHQLHFQLRDWMGTPVDEPFLRDTVNVPYYTDRMLKYPSIRLRMDFRDPNTIGTFVYHCHLLEHEDGGMMGLIRIEGP